MTTPVFRSTRAGTLPPMIEAQLRRQAVARIRAAALEAVERARSTQEQGRAQARLQQATHAVLAAGEGV